MRTDPTSSRRRSCTGAADPCDRQDREHRSRSGGQVLVKLPSVGAGRVSAAASYVPLAHASSRPVGTIVDSRRGHVELTTAIRRAARARRAASSSRARSRCRRRRTAVHAAVAQRVADLPEVRQVQGHGGAGAVTPPRGRDTGGKFRTRGRHSTATVRGTTWYTKDTCTTTTTVVRAGVVVVKDVAKHKNVTVKAGHRYVARAAKK